MRLAIAVTEDKVSQHFGHCEYFYIYNIENNKVEKEEKIINPPHQKNFLPKFLGEHAVDVVITGNLGSMAVNGLQEIGITPIRGVSGTRNEVLEAFLNETLVSSDEICEEHLHHKH